MIEMANYNMQNFKKLNKIGDFYVISSTNKR